MSGTGVELLARIRAGLIGEGDVRPGPYGPRRLTHADHSASGCALDLVEDAVRDQVLPGYADTHGGRSATGRLREEARAVIHRAVGGAEDDLVLFCGSGSRAAVEKLTRLLGLPARPVPVHERPVVILGPYRHHSDELPWRGSAADVVTVGEDRDGAIDVEDLRARLAFFQDRPLRIGSFCAASSVTGVLSDTTGITALLHAYGALSVWDYTAAAPYRPIRMREGADPKDAVVFSPHKLVGGPQTPGVLVVRRSLVGGAVPGIEDRVAREEGGTPAIVGSVRAGLVVALREAVGTDLILAVEQGWWRQARECWSRNPHLEILGDPNAPRLPIVAVRVHRGGRVLHHGFVVAVLDDLFGIRARAGCSCADPYGHRLLCITPRRSAALRTQVARGHHGIEPGRARITNTHDKSEAVVDFLIEAVDLVATAGHRLLGDYAFDLRSGRWRHRASPAPADVPLGDLLLGPGPVREALGEDVLPGHLRRARELLAARPDDLLDRPSGLPAELEDLRDFHLPAACLVDGASWRRGDHRDAP